MCRTMANVATCAHVVFNFSLPGSRTNGVIAEVPPFPIAIREVSATRDVSDDVLLSQEPASGL